MVEIFLIGFEIFSGFFGDIIGQVNIAGEMLRNISMMRMWSFTHDHYYYAR